MCDPRCVLFRGYSTGRKKGHCCGYMGKDTKDKYCPIYYSAMWREYVITFKESTDGGIRMAHCFNCGEELPHSLRGQWFDIIETEFGLDDPIISREQRKKIPKEFLTDEWWKKRGL